MKDSCGSHSKWYVPFLSVATIDFVPVKPTAVMTLSRPGPSRWKSWIDDRSLITKRYFTPALSFVTLLPFSLSVIVKPGPTVPTTVFGAADALPASNREMATTLTTAAIPNLRNMGSSFELRMTAPVPHFAPAGAVVVFVWLDAVRRDRVERIRHDRVAGPAAADQVGTGSAVQEVDAGPAEQRVVAGSAVEREQDRRCREASCTEQVVACQTVDQQPIHRGVGVNDRDQRRHAADEGASVCPLDLHDVIAARAVDRDRVGHQVTGIAADRCSEIDVDPDNIGRGQVVHGRRVRPPQRAQNDALGVVDVHHDVALLTEEAQSPAVGRGVERLAPGHAVEHQRVEAVRALDHVAAVAVIPDEGVVTLVEEANVAALIPVDVVVTRAAGQPVVAGSPEQRVVFQPAVQRERDGRSGEGRSGKDVIAPEAVHDQRVPVGLGIADARRRSQTADGRTAVGAADRDAISAVRPVDGDRIGRAVTAIAPDHRGEIDRDLDHIRRGKIVHGRRVRTAQHPKINVLGAVDVHHDVAGVTEEAQPLAIGGRVEDLVPARTVEDHRVEALLASGCASSVTGIPDEAVVTCAEGSNVAALVAVDGVVARAAVEALVPSSAEQLVVAALTVDGRRLRVGEDAVGLVDADAVVAVSGFDENLVEAIATKVVAGETVLGHDLDHRRISGAKAERDLVVRRRALDDQRPML